ncbi:MAG: hypothetical protein HN348_25630, partial [Proteobacteria bacterium]|nr:hypothetical protein [Pseudomonadota bacterium]
KVLSFIYFDEGVNAGYPLSGGELHVAYGIGKRVWFAVAAQAGTGWSTCPDCQTLAGTATVRGVVLGHPNFQAAPWMVLTWTGGAADWTPGIAVEGGSDQVRVDTSWPVWSTMHLLTTLRSTPELGVSYLWSETHRTRAAIVGLEPGFAIQHRVGVGAWTLEGTARLAEEGFGLEATVRWRL